MLPQSRYTQASDSSPEAVGIRTVVREGTATLSIWSFISLLRSSSEARLNHSTIHPERGTVGCCGQWAAHVSHQIGHFFRQRESLQKRRRADGLEKLLFKFCKRFAAAKLSRKFFHTG